MSKANRLVPVPRALFPLLALVALAACTGPAEPPPPPPASVRAQTIAADDLALRLKYPALVAAYRDVEVRARVSGVIVGRAYEEGQAVERGDLLFRIEPDTYQAVYEQALAQAESQRATIIRAESDYQRAQALVDEGAVSRREFDDARATLAQARAGLAAAEAAARIAKLNLDYTEVRAPVDGIASMEAVTVGNIVNGAGGAGGDLLTIVTQADPAYVEFSIAEPEMLRLRELSRGERGDYPVRIVSGSSCDIAGRLDFADSIVNAQTGTVRARAVFPNPDGCLLSGQYLSIELSGVTIPDAVAVPKAAILFAASGPMVWVLDDENLAEARKVEVGDSLEDQWIITSGLKGGERIVTEGILKVRPGQPVNIVAADGAVADRGISR